MNTEVSRGAVTKPFQPKKAEFNYRPGQVFKLSLAKVINCPNGWALLVNFIGILIKLWYNVLLFFLTVMIFFG